MSDEKKLGCLTKTAFTLSLIAFLGGLSEGLHMAIAYAFFTMALCVFGFIIVYVIFVYEDNKSNYHE